MTLQQAIIYWIHLPEHNDITQEGYVGVTQNLDKRLNEHHRDIKNKKHSNTHLVNVVEKYGWDNLIKDVIVCGEEAFCYEYEAIIRPQRKMGWNIAPGGHRGPGWPEGKKRDPEWLEEQRKKRAPLIEQNRIKRQEERRIKLEARRLKKEEKEKLLRDKKILLEEKRILREKINQEKSIRREERLKRKQERESKQKTVLEERPICPVCNKNHRAPAYYRNDKRYYRSRCNDCIRLDKNLKPVVPRWQQQGYKKKTTCDLCSFKSKYTSQITVWHINGNLNDSNLINLRCVCLNCVEAVERKLFTWKIGDLEVD